MVGCLHCGEEYESYRIEWRIETNSHGQPHGFWCCPIPGCDGRGFGCDIFPIDPDYRDEEGNSMWIADEEDDDSEELEFLDDDADADFPGKDRDKPQNDEDLPW